MFSLKNRNKGFTIVELLIVIVVIGILATLVIVTFTGIQQKARDSQRKTDINALDSHIEAYYAETGTYPALSMLQDSAWVTKHMKGLDPEALKDPKGGALQGSTDATHYGYTATTGSPAAACTVSGASPDQTADCDAFSVSATLESDGSTYSKASN